MVSVPHETDEKTVVQKEAMHGHGQDLPEAQLQLYTLRAVENKCWGGDGVGGGRVI